MGSIASSPVLFELGASRQFCATSLVGYAVGLSVRSVYNRLIYYRRSLRSGPLSGLHISHNHGVTGVKVLITGGAGFIGQQLSRSLLRRGFSVTILDNFLPQVHNGSNSLPADLAKEVRLVCGDIADESVVSRALDGVNRVVHLAAETGTGQSMYEVSRYSRTNLQGTAVLFEAIGKIRPHQIERFVVASSRAIYGEGAYRCAAHGRVYPQCRVAKEKQSGLFDPVCPLCSSDCNPVETPEEAPAQPSSFYGLTKLTQEQMTLLFGRARNIPSVALRYQNVFGPGQSLRNPYTGILAIFSNLARSGQEIKVFEDGLESRDFVYIEDVVGATILALLKPVEGCHSLNVGSGNRISVLDVAKQINRYFGNQSAVHVSGNFREGDIRHALADLNRIREVLGYQPAWNFQAGLERFLQWAEGSPPSTLGYEASLAELRDRGLLSG